MKEISVVLTTYNQGKYIRAAVESILAQTVKDFELIIVNDGSPDNTDEEISKIKDERIRYIRQEPSGLPANSRNRGIELAGGKFVAFFDGDDIWYPNKLQRCLEIIREHPETDIISHDVDLLRAEDDKVFKRSFFGPYEDDMYRFLLLKGNALSPTSTVIRRKVFSEDGFLFSEDKNLFTVEDLDLWLRLAKAKRYRFFYLPDTLAARRVFEGSATLVHIEKQALNMIYLLDKNIKDIDFSHKNMIDIIRKRKSRVLFAAALATNYRKQFRESIGWSLMAIRECPLYFKPYLGFLASLCRIRMRYL